MCGRTWGCPKSNPHTICFVPTFAKRDEFLEAAKEYAKLMLTDFRNARDAREIQKRIETARGRFYETYRNLEKENS